MQYKIVTALVLGSLSGLVFVVARWLKNRETSLTEREPEPKIEDIIWHRIGYVKEITLYPFKSGAGLELTEANLHYNGIIKKGICDRSVVCYTENNPEKLAWAGIYPRMLSINAQIIKQGVLQLNAPNMPPLELDLNIIVAMNEIARPLFPMITVECGKKCNEWVSKVVLNEQKGMRVNVGLTPTPVTDWKTTSRQNIDFMPIMVMHEKSIDDLNSRLAPKNKAHHRQFRGNLLVVTNPNIPAYDEDKWRWLRIGDSVLLHDPKPCRRCFLTNIDINTCERNPDFEPMKTLKSYRLREHPTEPDMGIYFKVSKTGILKRGDAVYVSYERKTRKQLSSSNKNQNRSAKRQ